MKGVWTFAAVFLGLYLITGNGVPAIVAAAHARGFWFALAVLILVVGFVVIAILSAIARQNEPAPEIQPRQPQIVNNYHAPVIHITATAAALAMLASMLANNQGKPLNGKQKNLIHMESDYD